MKTLYQNIVRLVLCALLLSFPSIERVLAQTTPPAPAPPKKIETAGQLLTRRKFSISATPAGLYTVLKKREKDKEYDAWAVLVPRIGPDDTPEDALRKYLQGTSQFELLPPDAFPNQKYQWLAGVADNQLFVPAWATDDDKKLMLPPASVSRKQFTFDFGEATPTLLDEFPKTTITQGAITSEVAGDAPRMGTATIHWHLQPQMMYEIKVQFEASEPFDDGSNDIWELIDEKMWRDELAIKVGANATVTALNTIYFDQAQGLLYAPLFLSGAYGVKTIFGKVKGLVGPIASALRNKMGQRLLAAGRTDSVIVKYIVTIGEKRFVGTMSKDGALVESATDIERASQALTKARTSVQEAETAAAATTNTLTKARNLEATLRAEGNVVEANRVAARISRLEQLEAENVAARAVYQQKTVEAQNALEAAVEQRTVMNTRSLLTGSGYHSDYQALRSTLNTANEAARDANEASRWVGWNGRTTKAITVNLRPTGTTNPSAELGALENAGEAAANQGQIAINKATTADGPLELGLSRTQKIAEEVTFVHPNPSCFVAGTPVTMTDGSLKAIEQIRSGDKVLSRDPSSGQTAAKTVTQTFERHSDATLLLQLASGTRIETTTEHPFYVEGRGWTPARELGIGTSIVTRAGPSVQVLAAQLEDTPATVYNLEVADFHTYFVGSAGAWVHNTCELPTSGIVVERNLRIYPPKTDGTANIDQEFTDLDRIERLANSDELLLVSERLNLTSGPNKAGQTASRARDTLDKYKEAATGTYKVHPDVENAVGKQALLDELRTKWAQGKVRIGLHLRHPDPSDELLRKTKQKVEEWEKTNGIQVGYKFETGALTDPVSPVE